MSEGSPPDAEHRRNTELLHAELPDLRFEDPDYLRWLYDENPDGPGFFGQRDDDQGRRVAHYALVPVRYRGPAGPGPFVFSLNAVTRSGAQRQGHFVEIGHEIFAAAAAGGRTAVTAVANANSTPGAVKHLGYRFIGPMPVSLSVANPFRGRDWTSVAVTSAYLESDEFAELAAELDDHEARGWVPSWQPDNLRWRLARPRGDYAVHIGPDLVVVSTRDTVRGIPFAVLMKLLPRRGAQPRSAADAVSAVCRYHRTPLAIHAGFNGQVPVPGIRLPERVRPVPLNLLVRSLVDGFDQDEMELDTFEFLECDPY